MSENSNGDNDFDLSVDLLYQSFLTWHRLQKEGIVKRHRIEDIQYSDDDWHHRYPCRFGILHPGSKCSESMLIGQGKYARVYQRYNLAYKIVSIHQNDSERIPKLKCNIKEMCFFHSMDHPHIMKCNRSQMVMRHGCFHKLIHEMSKARYPLQQMIYSHELTCFQDLVHILKGIAKGLQYMHKHRIIHGDIKPSNILITHRYEAFISDFTLTTFAQKGHEMAFGTLYWRSPECMLMKECSEAADVWAFGVMILDCLYGCNYMKDIIEAKNNQDLLKKLTQIIGQPSLDWITRYIPDQQDMLFHHDEVVDNNIREAKIQITVSDAELKVVMDLINKILQWNTNDRLTMDQVLQHPFFGTETITPLPQVVDSNKTESMDLWQSPKLWKMTLQDKVWVIHWRDNSEKQHLEHWIKFYYQEIFHTELPIEEDWFLKDTIILTKRVVDRLKTIEATFNVKSIIKYCVQFMGFIWKGYWPEQSYTFECILFHILNLLHFDIFAFDVKEVFLPEQARIHKEEEKKHDISEPRFNFIFNKTKITH